MTYLAYRWMGTRSSNNGAYFSTMRLRKFSILAMTGVSSILRASSLRRSDHMMRIISLTSKRMMVSREEVHWWSCGTTG